MRVRAVVNPRAGVSAQRALRALEHPPQAWGELDVKVTGGPGEARLLAEDAVQAGFDLVLAVGGDGTVNEVAGGLVQTEVALGVVPAGSGNGLARTLGVPREPSAALRALAEARLRRMDVGTANGRPFLNVAGAGFDASVGAEFQAWGRAGGRRGLFHYVRIAAGRAFRYRTRTWRLEVEGQRFEGPALVVAFLNGRQYGGGAVMAPGARLDDGLLDVVVIEDAKPLEMLANAPRLYLGTIERFRRYRHFPAAEAVLMGTGPFQYHRDGEPEPPVERLEIRLWPRALTVLVPPRASIAFADGA